MVKKSFKNLLWDITCMCGVLVSVITKLCAFPSLLFYHFCIFINSVAHQFVASVFFLCACVYFLTLLKDYREKFWSSYTYRKHSTQINFLKFAFFGFRRVVTIKTRWTVLKKMIIEYYIFIAFNNGKNAVVIKIVMEVCNALIEGKNYRCSVRNH